MFSYSISAQVPVPPPLPPPPSLHNMKVERHRAAQVGEGGQQSQAVNRVGGRREVLDMLSWLYWFSLSAAVLCESHPRQGERVVGLSGDNDRGGMTMQGHGWLLYDR